MEEVDAKNVMTGCQVIIDQKPDVFDINDACLDENIHSSQCLLAMTEWSQTCPLLEAQKATERLRRLPLRYLLTNCALDPERANGLFTFEGFKQDGPIYSIK